MFIWESKFRAIKSALKTWDKGHLDFGDQEKHKLQDELKRFQEDMESSEVIEETLRMEQELERKILRTEQKEEDE